MGTGAAVPGSTAEATHSPGTGPVPQGKASSPAGTQAALPGPPPPPPKSRCHPGALCPPAQAALALPRGTGPSCSSGAAPG